MLLLFIYHRLFPFVCCVFLWPIVQHIDASSVALASYQSSQHSVSRLTLYSRANCLFVCRTFVRDYLPQYPCSAASEKMQLLAQLLLLVLIASFTNQMLLLIVTSYY